MMKLTSHAQQRGRLFARRWFNPLLERGSRWLAPSAWLQGREVVYQNIVHRDLDRLGITTRFYPLRSAANYSFLYLLLRLVQDYQSLRVLELGAGQSTLLLNQFLGHSVDQLTTLEHDQDWAEGIGSQVASTLHYAPLSRRRFAGHAFDGYDPKTIADEDCFNVLLVDGPRGSRKKSRWTGLEFLAEAMGEEFVLIFDDAERPGEIQTVKRAMQELDARGVRYGVHLTRSVHCQYVIATPRFAGALYY